jgi:hypothetical protein
VRRLFNHSGPVAESARVALAVIRQAAEDLDDADPNVRENAERFLFGEDTTDLQLWLLRTGVEDVVWFQHSLLRKRRAEEKMAA